MKLVYSFLLLAFALPAQAGIRLGSDGVLRLDAQDNVPALFFVAPGSGGRVGVYHDADGAGLRLTFFPAGSVNSVVFTGGARGDLCWVQVPGMPCTFTGNGGADSMLGSPAGDNEFFADGQDFVMANRTDTIHGSPTVYFYP